MTDALSRLRRFLRELKRRKVYRVAAAYLVAAFVVLQLAGLASDAFGFPGWFEPMIWVIAVLGFPLAVVLAWAFEVTPEGVRRTSESEPAEQAETPEAWTRTAYKVLLGLGLVAAAVAGGWYLTGGGGESTDISEKTVVVLPFQVSGSGTDTWRDGMVSLLSTGLDGAAGLRAIPDRTVLATWEERRPGDGGATTKEALSVARQIGAQYAVVGTAAELGSELQLAATVHETTSGERLGQVKIRGSPDSVTALTDSLTRRVLGVLLEKSGGQLPSVRLESLTTGNLDALKAYLAGERHFRAGEYRAAIDDYETAVKHDSTFALAFERLAVSKVWIGEPEEPDFRRAYQLSDRLPARERRLLSALYAWNVPILPMQAADSLRDLTEEYPDDPRSWYYLAEVLRHGSVPGGWPEADTAFRRAVERDPGIASYYYHMVDLAMSLHHDSALTARRLADHPAGRMKARYTTLWELNFGSPPRRREARVRLDTLPLIEPPYWAREALNHPTDKALQGQVLRQLAQREATGGATIWLLARNHLDRGQIQQALDLLPDVSEEEARRVSPLEGSRKPCLLAGSLSLGYPIPDSILRSYLEPSTPPQAAELPSAWLRCSAIYLIEKRREDALPSLIKRMRRAAKREIDDGSAATARAQALTSDVRGYRAWKAGNLQQAARLWSQAKPSNGPWGAIWRGDLYRQLGELGKAERWYVAAWQHPVAHERLGQLYEEMGKPEKAAAAYRRFIEGWEDADPELQPRVEAARKRLKALTGSQAEANE